MNPLDAPTPAALFGDAAGDPRELRRAYARLIRAHGPEGEPEVFQHVRRLYEEGLAALQRATAATTTPAETNVDAEGEWVDKRLADIEREGLAAVLAALEERARAGSKPAFLAAAALVDASAPDRLVPLLVSLIRNPALSGTVGRIAELALAERPALLDAHDWGTIRGRCADPAARARLFLTEVDTLLALKRPDSAWERWEASGDEIRAADEARWGALTVRVLRLAGPGRPVGQLDRWIDRFWSAELGLEDSLADVLCRAACDAIAIGAARADATVPRALLDQLGELLLAEPLDRAAMLVALGADEARRLEIERLAERHPGVYSVVLRVFSTLNARDQALRIWHESGRPEPHPPVDARALVPAYEGDAADHAEIRQANWEVFRRRTRLTSALLLGAVGGALLAAWQIIQNPNEATSVGGLIILGFGAAAYFSSRGVIRPDAAERLGLGPTFSFPKLAAAIREACRDQGVWIHEAAAAARDDQRLHAGFDALLADPLSDLAVMGPGHTRRAAGPWRRAETAAPPDRATDRDTGAP